MSSPYWAASDSALPHAAIVTGTDHDSLAEALQSCGWRVSAVHASHLLSDFGTSARNGYFEAEAVGPRLSCLIHADVVVFCPSSFACGLSSASPPEIDAIVEFARYKAELGGAWVLIMNLRSPFWARAKQQFGKVQAEFKAADCAYWSTSQHVWHIVSSISELSRLKARCAHIHVSGTSTPPPIAPTFRLTVALAASLNKWADVRYLSSLPTTRVPAPECTGQRRGDLTAVARDMAMGVQFGFRMCVEGIHVPWRLQQMDSNLCTPVIFIGNGTSELREARTVWRSPFVAGRDGEYRECARWYADRLVRDDELLAAAANLAGTALVCECPVGLQCHGDVLAVAAFGAASGGAEKARRLLVTLGSEANRSYIPPRPSLRWPQEGIQHAIRRILPLQASDAKLPFIEDLVNASPFSDYAEWLEERGEATWTTQEPSWNFIRKPAWQRVLEGRQDGSFSSNKAAPPLVGFGLTKDEHLCAAVDAARDRGFPLDDALGIDMDIQFAACMTVRHRGSLRKFRQTAATAITHLAHRLEPLADQLRSLQPPTVRAVAGDMNLALVAVLIVLLQWPDVNLVIDYVQGFNIVGEVEASGVYPVNPKQDGREPRDLLVGAREYVEDLCRTIRRTRESEFLLEECLKDEERQLGDRLRSAEEMNERWGIGGWRPLPRFLVVQSSGKKRACDDGLRAGHNEATVVLDKLLLCSASQPGISAKALVAAAAEADVDLAAENASIESGTDDLPDAYRHVPVAPSQLNVHVVAVFDEGSEKAYFQELWGMVFGLAGSVACFNRWPRFLEAASRRFLKVLAAMYFDDMSVQDLASGKGSAQGAVSSLATALGRPFAPPKRQPMASLANFLGIQHDLSRAIDRNLVTFRPKPELVQKVEDMVSEAMQKDCLTPGAASKLRGVLGFMAREVWGKVARGGMRPLIQREFADDPPWNLSLSLMRAFEFHVTLLHLDAPRELRLAKHSVPPIVVASDGMFEENVGAGIASLFVDGSRRWGLCSRLPKELLSKWTYNVTPIQKVEGYAVLHGLLLAWRELRGRDVVWFIDNTSALASIVKGASRDVDLDCIVQTAYFVAYAGNIRLWWEYIPSAANWADGASRHLTHDDWARDNGFHLLEVPPLDLPYGPLLDRLESIAAWGDICGAAGALKALVSMLRRVRGSSVGTLARQAAPHRGD